MRFCGNCGKRLDTAPALTSIESLQDQLGVMMGQDLLERFQKAGLEAKGQRREVAILFVDLSGFTTLSENTESEALFDMMQRYIRMLVDTVYRFEGTVDKLTGDGLMALFGAPISHENNAERAVRTAISMQEEMDLLNKSLDRLPGQELKIHIGINVGEVIVGGMGTDRMMNYTAMGDSVNIARRLEENAPPGSIWVSKNVYEQTKAYFDYAALEPVLLKGIKEPVPVYQYQAVKPIPGNVRGLRGFKSVLVGRDAEISRLQHILDRLINKRQGGLVLIMGEAGIGKSRLTAEVKARIPSDICHCFEGRSLTYRKSIPYWIFRDLFYSCLGLTANTPSDEMALSLRRMVEEYIPRGVHRVLPYLEYLLSLDISDPGVADMIQYMDAELLRKRIFRAVRDLFIAYSHRKSLVLIFEDLHWADESSIELLLFLLNVVRQEPILIYVISRQFEGKGIKSIQEIGKQRFSDRSLIIQLEALPPDQASQLLSSLLDSHELPESFYRQIIQRSAGLPLYIEEILRMMIDKGVIYKENGTWKLKPSREDALKEIPNTLQGLILTRYDRLSIEEKHLLASATVIGYQFQKELLSLMVGEINSQTQTAILEKFVEQAFIEVEDSKDRYHFRHALVSDAIYSTLLERDKRRYHALAAEAIETLYQTTIDQQVEILAHHFSRSDRLDRAIHYLILAAEKAARGYANEQARQHYEQGLLILPKIPYRCDYAIRLHQGLGDVLVVIGEYQAARDHYFQAVQTILKECDNRFNIEKVVLSRKIATTFERQGDYEKALNNLQDALSLTENEPEFFAVERARILNDIGWIFFRRGNLEQAEDYLLKAQKSVDESRNYDIVASISNRLGGIAYQKNQFDLTKEYVTKSLVLREKIGDTAAVARSYNNLGLLSWKQAEWDDALEHFRRSADLQIELGDIEGMIEVDGNLGLLELDRGDTAEAHHHLAEALKNSRQIGHAHHIGFSYLYLTLYYLTVEDWDTALEYSRLTFDILKDLGVESALIELYTYTGLIWFGKGNLELAKKWAVEALSLYDKLEKGSAPRQVEEQARALRLLGMICLQNNELEDAANYFQKSEAIFVSANNLLEQGRTAVWLARLALAQNQTKPAEALLKKASDIFKRLGARLDLHKLETINWN